MQVIADLDDLQSGTNGIRVVLRDARDQSVSVAEVNHERTENVAVIDRGSRFRQSHAAALAHPVELLGVHFAPGRHFGIDNIHFGGRNIQFRRA